MRREVQLLGSIPKAGRQKSAFDEVLASRSGAEYRGLALRHCWFHNPLSILRATRISYVVAASYKLQLRLVSSNLCFGCSVTKKRGTLRPTHDF